MSVYNCYDCNTVLCKDCSRKHNDENKNQSHLMQLISNSFILNFKFSVTQNIDSWLISDLKCLPNGEVIVSLAVENIVKTFSVIGIQRIHVQLQYSPLQMTVVDKNTVAVLLTNYSMALVDIQQNHVQYIRSIPIPDGSSILIYIENEFYIGDEFDIVVLDMSGSVKRHITLSLTPCYMCYDIVSQHIYCIDRIISKLICIDRDGNDIFTYTDPSMTDPTYLTIDNDGNVLVLCTKRYDDSRHVIKVDSNGKKSEVVITNIKRSPFDPCICYDHLTNSVVIGSYNTVYIYKRK